MVLVDQSSCKGGPFCKKSRGVRRQKEIEAAVAIRPDDAGLAALKPYARALADWHFENEAFSCSGES